MSNCKVGDLAVVVRSVTGRSIGRIVRVVRAAPYPGLRNQDGSIERGLVWETDTLFKTVISGEMHPYKLDKELRPLRDQDGEDEMLRIAGKPKTTLLEECNRLIADFNKLAEWCKEHQK